MTRRLVVARALQPALAGDRALLLLGLAEGGSDFRVAGAIPAAGADIAAVEAMMPWPLGVVGWAQAASDEDPPATAEDLPVSCRGDEWQAGGEPATPDFSGCWHDGLGLVRARVAFSSDAATLADAVAQLGASLEHPKTVFVTRDGKGNVKTLDASPLGATWEEPAVVLPYARVARGGERGAAPLASTASATAGDADVEVSVDVEALAVVPTKATPAKTVAAVHGALRRLLDAAVAAAGGADADINVISPAFLPPGWEMPISPAVAVPSDAEDADAPLARWRADAHRTLGLARDRPALRLAQAISWGAQEQVASRGRLQDVHLEVEASSKRVPQGTRHEVSGSYDYFHYMQDRIDDSGWGCAYRSLQTVWSWFQRAHYTSAAVPTHREVQTLLVKLGDKPPSFIGSRQWIGAIELGYVLDDALGVTCKVLTVNSGDDVPTLARSIARHFDEQGTPIMIGGGVLAYTLLGIDWNEETGEVAFLILDPHYTGSEDIKKIKAGGWVAWKRPGEKSAGGGELFVSGAHYNFLCPQRPSAL